MFHRYETEVGGAVVFHDYQMDYCISEIAELCRRNGYDVRQHEAAEGVQDPVVMTEMAEEEV